MGQGERASCSNPLSPGFLSKNFIFTKLATKLGIHDFKMGDTFQADGMFKGQEVSINPLKGKV